jgi:hypothetical protein
LNERPQLIPSKINLTDLDINKIQSVISLFKQKDFSDKNIFPAHDGMSTNTFILFSDGHLIQSNPMNSPNQKQRQLYSTILDILISKNKNKNDSIILEKIKGYH